MLYPLSYGGGNPRLRDSRLSSGFMGIYDIDMNTLEGEPATLARTRERRCCW